MRRALPLLLSLLALSACGRGGDRASGGEIATGEPPVVGAEIDRLAIVPDRLVAFVDEETPVEVWGRFLGGWKPLGLDDGLAWTTEGDAYRFNGVAVQGVAEGTGVLRVTRGRLTAEAVVEVRPARRATGIVIGPAPLVLSVGLTQQLRILALWDDGTASGLEDDPQLLLSVSGDAASLSGTTVRGEAPGQARLTASWRGLQANLGLRVIAPERELVALEVTPAFAARPVGSTVRFTVTGRLSDGASVDLSRGSSGTTYTPSVEGIVEDRGDGLFFARAPGELSLDVRNGDFRTTVQLVVEDEPSDDPLVGLEVTPAELRLSPGETTKLEVTAFYASGSSRDVTADADTAFWSSSPEVATVSEAGEVTAQGGGEARLTVQHGGLEAFVYVGVERTRRLIGFGVNPDRLDLRRGESVLVMAIGTFDDGTQEDLACESSWASFDPGVAVAQGCGLVTAQRRGETTIEVLSPDGRFTSTLTVFVRGR